MKKTFTFLMITVLAAFSAKAQNFTQGNLAVLVAAASANNTTFSVAELSSTTAGQTSPVKTFNIPGVLADDANALRFSGSASSTGYLSRSADGTLLTFNGVNTSNTSTNINALGISSTSDYRGVGTLGYNYVYNLATTYKGVTSNQTRSATSFDNTNWIISDQNGLYSNDRTSILSGTDNSRSVKPFGGVAYVIYSNLVNIVALTPTSGGPITAVTVTGLPGFSAITNLYDFYLVSSNGSTYDILYTVSNNGSNGNNNTDGTISKFSLVSDTWISNGTYTTTFAGFGLAAEKNANGANLYVTTGAGALTANSVIKLIDAAGYNTPLSITTSNNVTLYTTATGTIIKGIDFAPIAPSTTPVKLISFTGKAQLNGVVKFNWATAEEANFSHFELEESVDGKSFNKIGTIASKKVATGSSYEYTAATTGEYFRLRQVDLDGTAEYSNVVFVKKENADALVVFPNPATEKVNIQLSSGSSLKTLTLLSVSGQVVKQATFVGNQYELAVSSLPKGVYYIKVVDEKDKSVYAKSIIVQ